MKFKYLLKLVKENRQPDTIKINNHRFFWDPFRGDYYCVDYHIMLTQLFSPYELLELDVEIVE